MYRGARATIALIAITVSALALTVPAQASGTPSTGSPLLYTSTTTVQRGSLATIEGGFLQPASTYTLSADHGRFANATSTETETTDQNGRFNTRYYLTGDVASSSVTLSLTSPGSSGVLASLTITVGAPSGQLSGRVCPGTLRSFYSLGFLDGSYHLSSTAGLFVNTSATASNGSLNWPNLRLPVAPPHQFTITVTRIDSGEVTLTDVETLATPQASASYSNPWERDATADCFGPNETVHVQPASGYSAPTSVTASGGGTVSVTFTVHPASQPSHPDSYGQLLGGQTGQATTVHPFQFLTEPGTTLSAGQSLDAGGPASPDNGTLVSPSIGYQFEMNNGSPLVVSYLPYERSIWTMVNDYAVGSTLRLLTNGNLALYGPTGQLRWQSGTAGTGSANRLVMQQNGNLVLSTSTGALLWSKDTGQVRNAQGLVSYAYLASSRYRSAVYVNGLVHQKSSTGQLIAGVGRTVYLQRYLNGYWQNVLARTTASHGQLSVGFIQSAAYRYRLLVLPTTSAAGATSGSAVR